MLKHPWLVVLAAAVTGGMWDKYGPSEPVFGVIGWILVSTLWVLVALNSKLGHELLGKHKTKAGHFSVAAAFFGIVICGLVYVLSGSAPKEETFPSPRVTHWGAKGDRVYLVVDTTTLQQFVASHKLMLAVRPKDRSINTLDDVNINRSVLFDIGERSNTLETSLTQELIKALIRVNEIEFNLLLVSNKVDLTNAKTIRDIVRNEGALLANPAAFAEPTAIPKPKNSPGF